MSSINGKTVLVTGASIGIGEQIALALGEKGANLILFSRTEDYEGVEAGVKNAIKEMGDIDILVNNAGLALGAPATFQDLSISDIYK
ncbi:hypothetical protein V499_05247 [Pseudogymnoascus sp. VKM F-103]|nr:hypothetical protein V499_05247 [Pseudogymnoascus sp. VKM F-103]